MLNQLMYRTIFFLGGLLLLASCESLTLYLQGQQPARIEQRGNTLYLSGILGKVSARRLQKALKQTPTVDTLVIIRSDGSVYDEYNLKIAEELHRKGVVTRLLPYSQIASGAVDLFLAGKTRIVPQGAKIGIHSWKNRLGEGADLPTHHKAHQQFLEYYQKVGVDTSFYWYSLHVARYDDIHWLTEEEIQRFEVRKE